MPVVFVMQQLWCVQVRPTASQRRKLKQLHWDKIKTPQEGTIWHQSSGLNPNLNFAELESLFQVHHLGRCMPRGCSDCLSMLLCCTSE